MKGKYIAVFTAVLLILWYTGFIGLWIKGIAFIANNTKDFTTKNGHALPGEYSVSIDLSDLESNIGKELYNDGKHRIYVGWVDNTGTVSSGGYRIGFRSSGRYSLAGAALVTGIQHITLENKTSTSRIFAEMKAEYNGKIYNSPWFAMEGLHYKDGDAFCFYIFPPEPYKNKEISLKEKGAVKLTVTNLYKNIWSKK